MDEENAAAANRLFSHLTGKIVERRVLNVDTPYAVIEITMTNSGTFGGRQANDLVTYVQKQRADGLFDGTAKAVVTGTDGQNLAVWTGYGVGHSDGRGGIIWEGGILVRSTLEQLNGVAACGYCSVTGDGKVTQRFYRVR